MRSSKENLAESQTSVSGQLQGLLDILIDLEQTEPKKNLDSQSNLEKKQHQSPAKSSLIVSPPQQSESSNLHQLIAELQQKQAILEQQIYEPIDLINNLLPLIKELLEIKANDSRAAILEAVVPVIDEIIKQKSVQDSEKMASAIAAILPPAISQEINNYPQEIAKAIAPEVALSIQEQIRLDPNSISTTLGPEMGKAIKTQIELERDAMVDALYPVIGNTISKYMAEAIKTINDKVENALSLEGIQRKIRAKIQGVSEAELILAEAINCEVEAIFLIHKISGLVIQEVQSLSGPKLEADMLAGMLTAIRSFVNECVFQSEQVSELNEIDYNDRKIILEVAGYCYLAVVVKGEPSKKFIQKIRDTLSTIVLRYGKAIEDFDGDRATIPQPVQPLLDRLIQTQTKEKKSQRPTTLLILLLILLSAIILPWGYIHWRSRVASQLEYETAVALDAAPQLSVYRLIPHISKGKLTLSGRVPHDRLRILAAEVAVSIATRENLELDNQILAVKIPPDAGLTAGEVQRVTSILNQRNGVKISSHFGYKTKTVTVVGTLLDVTDNEQITQVFKQIPGVDAVVSTVQIQLPTIETRIYFDLGSAKLKSKDISSKIKAVQQFLDRHPRLHLKIIGHSDGTGKLSTNQELVIKRASSVQQALIDKEINPARLHISGTPKPPLDFTSNQPLWLTRCVRFEVFIPPQTSN